MLIGVCCFGIASLSAFPHSQSYFNYLAGGWRGGPRYLLGSNVEWGQDLFFLKTWLAKNADKQPLYVAWPSNRIHPYVLATSVQEPPKDLTPGWYVISFKSLYSRGGEFAAFRQLRPVDYVAHSMAVYYLPPQNTADPKNSSP